MMKMVWRKEFRFGFLKLITSFGLSFGLVSILPLSCILRRNRFSKAESALKADMGSFDYKKFLLPMVPPSPPVRILSTSCQSEAFAGTSVCSRSSSVFLEDGFVVLGASISDICSSDAKKGNCIKFYTNTGIRQ